MKDQIIEFQKHRIEALETENLRLKTAIIRKEASMRAYVDRLAEYRKDPVFQLPILNYNNDSNSTVPRKQN